MPQTDMLFNIKAKIQVVKSDIEATIKQSIKNATVGVTGGKEEGGKTSDNGKKSVGLLGGILGKMAIVAGLLMAVKPLTDMVELILNLFVYFIFKVLDTLNLLPKEKKEVTPTTKTDMAVAAGLLGPIFQIIAWMKIFSNYFNVAKDVFKGIWDAVGKFGETLLKEWEEIKKSPERLWKYIKLLPEQIYTLFHAMYKVVRDAMLKYFPFMAGAVKWLESKLGPFVKRFEEWTIKLWKKFISFIEDKFPNLAKKVVDILKKAEDIYNSLKNLAKSIGNAIKNAMSPVISAVNKLIDFMGYGPDASTAQKVANVVVPGIGGAIVSAAEMAYNALKPTSNADLINSALSVKDALITNTGKIVKLDPSDNVLAFKGAPPGGGGTQKVFNFYGVTPQEMMKTIKRELATDTFKSSRF